MQRFFPFLDLRGYDREDLRTDVISSITLIFMAVPQGVAYALIAGLPPAVGLYAATVPTIVGSLFRSSKHVVVGPTNAISLLVGGAIATGLGADPITVGVTLALMVGIMQWGAGFLGLGALVDFISSSVVLGYITGAAVLIGVGQLPNLTGTEGARGHILYRIGAWIEGLGATNGATLTVGLGTAALILVLRRVNRRLPGPMIAMALATLASYLLGLDEMGVTRVRDLNPVPRGLPPFTLPELSLVGALLPFAVAASVLSLVESSAVARGIAAQTGQRLDPAAEFMGQGLSNVAAGFFGGYPVSGSLSRSALNHRSGARTRMAGVYSGLLMIAVLLVLGPLVNETPIASLAGLLLIVVGDFIDRVRIIATVRAGPSDGITFLATLLGTWALSLDKAIYIGVGISLIFVLRQARLVTIRELTIDDEGHLQEVGPLPDEETQQRISSAIRVLQVEGRLFFGIEGELRNALDDAIRDDRVKVLVVRLKRSQGMDITVARVFEEIAGQLRNRGGTLLLAGVAPDAEKVLERTEVLDELGADNVFSARSRWFESLGVAIQRARELTGVPDPSVHPHASTTSVTRP
jgi:SulP family sulfate permease